MYSRRMPSSPHFENFAEDNEKQDGRRFYLPFQVSFAILNKDFKQWNEACVDKI